MTRRIYAAAAFLLAGCSQHAVSNHVHTQSSSVIDASFISADALVNAPEAVSCQLETGASAECLKVVVKYLPDSLKIGPFCPATLEDKAGIWNWTGEHAGLYRVDGEFLRMLNDLGYRFYDDQGKVYQSDIAVAQPEHDHTCINVSVDEAVEITMLLPLNPVKADTPSRLGTVGKVGLALNGTPIFSDAPSIEHTGHMPALDPCGGHVDPGGWYHWHANSSDIDTVLHKKHVDADCGLPQSTSALFGYAFDGFPIFGSTDADGDLTSSLDDCNGHVGQMLDGPSLYHYHTPTDFPNLPKCLVGVQAAANFLTTAQAGIGADRQQGAMRTGFDPPGGGPGGPPPSFAAAAESLGISEEDLFGAVRKAGGPNLDFALAAKLLNVDEAALRAALPQPPLRQE